MRTDLEPVADRSGLALSLAAGQVDQVQLRRAYLRSAGGVVAALEVDREDRVAARRRRVHRGRGGGAVLPAAVHDRLAGAHARHCVHRQVLDEHGAVRSLVQLQPRLDVLAYK